MLEVTRMNGVVSESGLLANLNSVEKLFPSLFALVSVWENRGDGEPGGYRYALHRILRNDENPSDYYAAVSMTALLYFDVNSPYPRIFLRVFASLAPHLHCLSMMKALLSRPSESHLFFRQNKNKTNCWREKLMRKQTTMTTFVVVRSRVVCATNNQGPVGCCFDYRQDGLGTTRVGWLNIQCFRKFSRVADPSFRQTFLRFSMFKPTPVCLGARFFSILISY